MEECRLRDPPQAENPASQGFFLSYRKLCFIREKCSVRMRTRRRGRWLLKQPRLGANVPRHILFTSAYGIMRSDLRCLHPSVAGCACICMSGFCQERKILLLDGFELGRNADILGKLADSIDPQLYGKQPDPSDQRLLRPLRVQFHGIFHRCSLRCIP